jgi:hypothetical protein
MHRRSTEPGRWAHIHWWADMGPCG